MALLEVVVAGRLLTLGDAPRGIEYPQEFLSNGDLVLGQLLLDGTFLFETRDEPFQRTRNQVVSNCEDPSTIILRAVNLVRKESALLVVSEQLLNLIDDEALDRLQLEDFDVVVRENNFVSSENLLEVSESEVCLWWHALLGLVDEPEVDLF